MRRRRPIGVSGSRERVPRDPVRVRPHIGAASPGQLQDPADRQPSGTWMTRVPQFRTPVVVWLDLGGMYSVASHAESDASSGTAKEESPQRVAFGAYGPVPDAATTAGPKPLPPAFRMA